MEHFDSVRTLATVPAIPGESSRHRGRNGPSLACRDREPPGQGCRERCPSHCRNRLCTRTNENHPRSADENRPVSSDRALRHPGGGGLEPNHLIDCPRWWGVAAGKTHARSKGELHESRRRGYLSESTKPSFGLRRL